MLLKVFQAYMFSFVTIRKKLCGDEKNNNGSDTDSCAQGRTMKCYLTFNARICFGSEIHTRMCEEYGTQNVNTINCEPMGTDIQGEANKGEK